MYENIPDRFVPDEGVPEQIFANPRINSYAYNRDKLNTTYELFERGFEMDDWGNQSALLSLDTDETVTYDDLRSMVDAFAGVFREIGVESGDRVCCRLGEKPEAVAAQFAIWKVGGVAVPCPLAARKKEISYYLSDTEASVLITDDRDIEEARAAAAEVSSVEEVIVDGVSKENERSMDTLLTETEDSSRYASTRPFDAASVFYTGGTTGKPKGCIHSHVAEVAITILECAEGRAIGADDTLFCPAPIGHSLGNGEMVNFPFRFGADVVLTHRPSPSQMVKIIEEQEVTIFVGSPTMLRMMLSQTTIEDYDLSSLRLVIVGGEMFDEETFDEWTERSGIEPCNTVGMSQLRHWFISSYRNGEKVAPKLSVGQPYAGFEKKLVKIDNPEVEVEGPDTVGRLAIRGPTNINYWNNIHPDMPEVMNEYSVGDWGLADDAYQQDEEGYLYFETRLDNMITSAGRQISGPEVEDVLIRHDMVSEVAVVGSPDDVRGEIVKAFVVPNEGASPGENLITTLQGYVKGEMAPYKYPREIEFVDKLPKDEMGKLQRATLREREHAAKPRTEAET